MPSVAREISKQIWGSLKFGLAVWPAMANIYTGLQTKHDTIKTTQKL